MVCKSSPGTPGISTHAPRTGSDDYVPELNRHALDISTHAPRTGSDAIAAAIDAGDSPISTHAPRTGSDPRMKTCRLDEVDFNPRSPHGERRCVFDLFFAHAVFQPTLPARGATRSDLCGRQYSGISTHAPRTGSDMPIVSLGCLAYNFNPRSPHGERRVLPARSPRFR